MPFSAVLITITLILYTTATWSERISRVLEPKHLMLFWFGLLFDFTGTSLMIQNSTIETFSLHSLTGYAGIVLMFIHTVWASMVIARNNDNARKNFHKFSLSVWTVWIFSYLNGAYLGMAS